MGWNTVEIWTRAPLPYLLIPAKGSSGWQTLTGLYGKSWDCLLKYWRPMTSILFLKEAIYCNIFRWNYLFNENFFLNFSLHFRKLNLILNIFKKKITVIVNVFLNLWTLKTWLDKWLKCPASEGPSTSNMVNGPKHC